MALSLNDIKKNKDRLNKPKKKAKVVKKARVAKKTKPWQKPNLDFKEIISEPEQATPDLLQKALDWGRKIKIYPKIDIPIPDFLLTKEDK